MQGKGSIGIYPSKGGRGGARRGSYGLYPSKGGRGGARQGSLGSYPSKGGRGGMHSGLVWDHIKVKKEERGYKAGEFGSISK